MSDDRARLMGKIQKCLRLGKSSEAHEAAAALRQAQKLMEMHGITEEDLAGLEYSDLKIDVPIQANRNKIPAVLAELTWLIRKAFGVKSVIGYSMRVSDISYQIRYFGPTTRVQMAGYTHTIIHRAVNAAWTKFLNENPHLRGDRGARSSFQLAWLQSVEEKVMEVGFSDEEERGTELAMKKVYGDRELATAKANNTPINFDAVAGGIQAASSFNIHRPMNESTQRRLGRS